MRVYRVKLIDYNGPCIWKTIDEAIKEIKSLLEHGSTGDRIWLHIDEMDQAEFDRLPEFEGY